MRVMAFLPLLCGDVGRWRSNWPVNKSSGLLAAMSLPAVQFPARSRSTIREPFPAHPPEELNCFITATQMLNHGAAVPKINLWDLHCTTRPRVSVRLWRGLSRREWRCMYVTHHPSAYPHCASVHVCALYYHMSIRASYHHATYCVWLIHAAPFYSEAWLSDCCTASLRSVSSCKVSILSGFLRTH